MGMTIEKADKTLLEFYHYIKGDVHFCGYNEDNVLNTIDFVRNIMRKYRTIEQALNSWDMNCINDREFINTIREVLEDGNN